jgi:hypothetical protein
MFEHRQIYTPDNDSDVTLEQFSAEGWEVVAAWPVGDEYPNSGVCYLFKRPMTEAQKQEAATVGHPRDIPASEIIGWYAQADLMGYISGFRVESSGPEPLATFMRATTKYAIPLPREAVSHLSAPTGEDDL